MAQHHPRFAGIWTRHDETFAAAIASELGILLDAGEASVSIMRFNDTVQVFTLASEGLVLSLIAGPNRVQVQSATVGGKGQPWWI